MIVDDIGGLLGPISCPPIPGVIHTLDGRRNMRRFVHFRTDAHTWLGMIGYLHTYRYTYIYIYISDPLLFFLFFFLFLVVTLGVLFCIDGLMAAWHTSWPRVQLGLTGGSCFRWKSFQFSRIFQGKGPFDLYLSFLLSLPLATFSPSFCEWFLQLPKFRISPLVFSVSS